jgi:hypothetical protein
MQLQPGYEVLQLRSFKCQAFAAGSHQKMQSPVHRSGGGGGAVDVVTQGVVAVPQYGLPVGGGQGHSGLHPFESRRHCHSEPATGTPTQVQPIEHPGWAVVVVVVVVAQSHGVGVVVVVVVVH